MEKVMLRQAMVARRHTLDHAIRRRADAAISAKLLSRPEVEKAATICCYVSLAEEVDTKTIIKELLRQGKTVVVPRLENDGLRLYCIESFDDLTKGTFGVLEPKVTCRCVSVSAIDVFIVPGIAFDRRGYRVGWGKGYYDRLLATIDAVKIGLAYELQIVPRLPVHSYDIQMNTVITEGSVVIASEAKQSHSKSRSPRPSGSR